jgi:hypothetical protein
MALNDKPAAGGSPMALNDKPAAASPEKAAETPTPPTTARLRAESPMPPSYGAWLLPAYLVGLVLVFIGERIVSSDGVRYACSGLGLLAATVTTAVRFARSGTASGERGRAERVLAFFSAGGLAALGLYFATTETGRRVLGITAAKPETRAHVEGAMQVGWVAVLLLSVLPLCLGELALAPMRRATMIEARRVRAAIRSGLILAAAALYTGLFTYAASELDVKVDYSYFRTARPSESTRNIAAGSTEPIQIKAFFPQLNEVGTEVAGYLRDLGRHVPNLKIEEYDRLLVPAVAKEAKVTSDGVIVLTRGASRETLTVGTDMKVAAGRLKSLDSDFQKSLLKVMREAHVAYLTVGHGELNENRPDAAEGRSVKLLRKLFEAQNYTIKDLGVTQGLGTDVPADATLVAVLGPSQALLPEEVASLRRYADRGGHLLLLLDPEAKVDLDPLAALAGLRFSETVLANDKVYMRRRFNNSDRTNLGTNRFSSHASVSSLSRNSSRMGVILLGASALDKRPDAAADLKIDFAVKALGDTFEDKKGSFEFDPADGKRQSFNLAAAVSKTVPAPAGYKGKDPPDYRAFVVGDADAFSDAAFGNEPNILFAADVLRWLGGEESFSGAITSAEDVRIEHTKETDAVWFYGTILGAPLLVLGVGLVISRLASQRRGLPVRAVPKEKSA